MPNDAKPRRHSVAAMPSSSESTLQRNGLVLPSTIAPRDRVRRVSFEVPEDERPQLSNDRPRVRRHSSVLTPFSGTQQRTPLSTLPETGGWGGAENTAPAQAFVATPRLTAEDLIKACLQDADDYVKPNPIPGGSSAMVAILHDMKQRAGERDVADSDCDVIDRGVATM